MQTLQSAGHGRRAVVITGALLVGLCGTAWAKGGTKPVPARKADGAAPTLKGDAALKRLQELELQRAAAADVMVFMRSDEPAVRARAALCLGRLQDWTVAEELVSYLADPDPQVRKATAFALGELDPVMPLLVTQIKAGRKGDDPAVKGPALARAAAEKKLDARLHLEDRADVRKALYSGLGPLAIGAGLHHLQFGLEAGEDEAAWAARALGIHGYRRRQDAVQDKEITEALRKLLNAKNDDTRFGATYAMFRLGVTDVAQLSERLATDTDARVRIYAARGLAGKSGAEEALAAAVRDPDWRVRVEAVRALAEAPKPRGLTNTNDAATIGKAALDAFTAFSNGTGLQGAPMAHVVLAAATALSHAPPTMAMPHLDALAAQVGVPNSSNAAAPAHATSRKPEEMLALRCGVARALDVITGGPSRVLSCGDKGEPAHRPQVRSLDVLGGMVGSDGERARRMAGYLRHENAHVRQDAAELLAELDPVRAPDVGTLLAEQLSSETDPGAAFAMADGLIKRPAPSAIAPLRKALKRFGKGDGDNAEASFVIIQALVAANATDAVDDIRPLLQSASVRTRNAAQAALNTLGSAAAPLALRPPVFQPEDPQKLPARATLKTARGDVVVRFYREDAPLTVTSFVKLAQKGFFKGLTFHRVVSDFVVQGGDPRGDGFGGPGYQIPCEYNPRPYERGVLGMALSGKDSGGSQFFITQSPQPHLDGQYTAFGEVESGMDVVDALMVDDVILDVTVQ